jgi:ribosome-associated protein
MITLPSADGRIQVTEADVEFQYVRSSGPGGQNVNKVNSKAVMRFRAAACAGVPAGVLARLRERFPTRFTGEGEILIASDEYRDRERNRAACWDRLRELLAAVAFPPRKRRPTRPTRGSQERRLAGKRVDSARKQARRPRATGTLDRHSRFP